MEHTNLIIAAFVVLIAFILFFALNGVALRIFSMTKLQDAFNAKRGEERHKKHFESLIANSEKLYIACETYKLIFNMLLLALIVFLFIPKFQRGMQTGDYVALFFIPTILFTIFSLILPHVWAKYAGEKILSRTHELLFFLAWLASPVLYIFKINDKLIRRLTGTPESSPEEQKEEREEEFLTELEQHKIEGAVDAEEQLMIERVLQLRERYASEIMTPRTDIVAVEVNSDLQSVLKTITNAGFSRFPVYEGNIDNVLGLIYAKDLLSEVGKANQQFNLRDKLRAAYFVPETKPLRILLREFQSQKLHIAILLDEYGGTAGIVTLEDILEQLVGEIADEYDRSAVVPIKTIDKNTVEVDARMSINDLNQQLDLELPESEDYDTIAGFVFSVLGHIPKTGKSFEWHNLKFTIAAAEPRKIKSVIISRQARVEAQ